MGFSDETPVFVETNLGTHLALPVPPDITAGDLKSKLRQEHLSYFTNLGEIRVHALMVKRRSHFYHLPDPMPIKCAFQGFSGTWFLRMHASQLQDMPTSIPSTVQPTGQVSLGQGEPLKPAASQKLTSSNNSQHCNDQSRESHDSMSNISDVTDFSQSETIITFREKNSSIGEEQQLEGLPFPAFTTKKRIERIAKATHVLESVSGQNPENQKQLKVNTTMDECIGVDRNYKNLLLEHPSDSRENPSMNVSEKISVTGIISRFFSDFDEVNSCSNQPKHKLEESCNNEITGSTMRASEHSVHQKSPKRVVESDTDTVCSINNIIALDVKQFEANIMDMNVVTASIRVGRAVSTGSRKTKKTTSFVVRNKAKRSKKMFSPPSFDKHEVGKKVIQAANNISISGSRKRSSKSMFISRCGNLSAPESNVLVRNIAFEIDDFDD